MTKDIKIISELNPTLKIIRDNKPKWYLPETRREGYRNLHKINRYGLLLRSDHVLKLNQKYNDEIVSSLKGNYKSVMQVPKLVKIIINQGVGKGSSDKKLIDFAQKEITLISGQKAMITKSRKDISNFKLRKGMPVGVKVTLRGDRMYEFLDRLITAALPRVRDFKGISPKGFDGRGNYTLGIKEQIAFPEISIDRVNNITGMDITFVTNATSDEDARKLLTELGLPFKIKN